tara:strand:+ start:93 stop:248 length:156 start_codon:yes stop_codon:yes gene_type:complete
MKANIDLVKTALARHPLQVADPKESAPVSKNITPEKALNSAVLGVISKEKK